jgi:hypothetical protein
MCCCRPFGVASLEDFDRYVEENNIADGDLAQAFADWLAKASGKRMARTQVELDAKCRPRPVQRLDKTPAGTVEGKK